MALIAVPKCKRTTASKGEYTFMSEYVNRLGSAAVGQRARPRAACLPSATAAAPVLQSFDEINEFKRDYISSEAL